MKKFILSLAFAYLIITPSIGSNRTDINSDQEVNALDLSILSNVLAGNLDGGNYNLENVVVVAPQGGDFTDPADAADWVASQSPSHDKRFVIQITPGDYQLSRPIVLSSYTTLKGSCSWNSSLRRTGGSFSYPYNAVIVCEGVYKTTIKDLKISKNMGGSGTAFGILIAESSQYVKIKNCHIAVYHDVTLGVGVWVENSDDITIYDSRVDVIGSYASGSNSIAAIYLYESGMKVLNSQLYAGNSGTTGTRSSYCVRQDTESNRKFTANHTLFENTSGSGDAYYYYRGYSSGTGIFRFCYLLGDTRRTDRLTLTVCNK